jgi:hypothetical protein
MNILPDHVPFAPGPLPTELPEGRYEIDDGSPGPYAARPTPVRDALADAWEVAVELGPLWWLIAADVLIFAQVAWRSWEAASPGR